MKLTPERSDADQARWKVGQVAEVVVSEELVKVVVRDIHEEEEPLGV